MYDDDDFSAERTEMARERQARDFMFGGPEFHEDWMDEDDEDDEDEVKDFTPVKFFDNFGTCKWRPISEMSPTPHWLTTVMNAKGEVFPIRQATGIDLSGIRGL